MERLFRTWADRGDGEFMVDLTHDELAAGEKFLTALEKHREDFIVRHYDRNVVFHKGDLMP